MPASAASNRWPFKWRDEQLETSLRYYTEKRDPKENEETRPPPGESVELQSVLLAECYAPSTVSGLRDGLEALGWLADRPNIGGEMFDPAQFVGAPRSLIFSGSWAEIGFIHGPDWEGLRSFGVESELPPGIEYAWAAISTPIPTLTILVVQFVLKNGPDEQIVNRELARDQATEAKKTRTGYAFVTPRQLKERAVRHSLQEVEDRCAAWLKSRLPGSFAAGLADGVLPSCRVLLVDQASPFDGTGGFGDWMWAAGLSGGSNAWTSVQLTGLRLRVPSQPPERRELSALTLAGRRQDVFADKSLSADGPPTRWELAQWLRESFDGNMSYWALVQFLRAHQEAMASARDVDPRPKPSRKDLIEQISGVHAQLRLGRDGEDVARDLCEPKAGLPSLDFMACEFTSDSEWAKREGTTTLLDSWRRLIATEAEAYSGRQADLNANLTADAQLLQSEANLSLQRGVSALTKVSALVAFATLIVALGPCDEENESDPAPDSIEQTQQHPERDAGPGREGRGRSAPGKQ
ncbi:MAG: hypothetical protein M3355_02475 [Actinomycetota bacterium]|nr:hypothetical protein [Actinomycetota bacterium]